MDTLSAFAMSQASKGNPMMVFDWIKAATIIRDENPTTVEAGLESDWEYTGGTIFQNGQIVENECCYLASNWATPQISVDGELRDCFVMQADTEWNANTIWPDEAKAILSA